MLATLSLPLSAHDLREAVRQARPFNPARLDRVLRLDTSKGVVEVQASTAWASLAAHLRPGCAEIAAAWRGASTIGESVATNEAGPDGRATVEHVEALTLITLEGELRRVCREANTPLFGLVVGGQGLFGTLYSVTLRLESLARAAAGALPSASLDLAARDTAGRPLDLLVPPEALERFLAEARSRCAQWRIDLQGARVRRALAENETVLRWATREYAAVTLWLEEGSVLGRAVRVGQLRRELIDSAIAHGGSFPIASNGFATRVQLEKCYPALRGFLAEKRRLDPAQKLSNPWYRHHRALMARDACAVRWGA